MVIAKQMRTRNYFILNGNGYPSFSGGDREILGKNTCFFACWPIVISAYITFLQKLLHTILVPLHKPFAGSKFLRSMIGQLTFNSKLCGGSPFGKRVFKNSSW